MVKVGEKAYHSKCFVCHLCHLPFENGKYVTKDDQAHCMKCAEETSQFSCEGCAHKIVGKVFAAINKNWHPACFKCQKCFKQISTSFKVVDNLGYHPECMQNLCAACHKACSNEYL